MKNIAYLFIIYVLLFNTITTYRLLKDDTYETIQKIIQFILIWCVPFIGAMFVSYFLNAIPKKATKWWQSHWLTAGLIALLFHIRYQKKRVDGYPSDMNAYSDYAGGWYDGGCDSFGDGGACGGGD
ncbi:MAG: hypothetical protein L3J47_08640 [Sulfurovum sp.]|nr:hypothetical protein [Sulfurovum sp.]